MSIFGGIKIVESPLATHTVPNRKHRRRSWMRKAYHARIQKKWTKRFGTHQEPAAYMMSPGAVGLLGTDQFVVHPALMAKIRNIASPLPQKGASD